MKKEEKTYEKGETRMRSTEVLLFPPAHSTVSQVWA